MLAKTHFFEIIKGEHGSAIPIICFGFDFAPFYNKNPLYGQFYEYLYNVFPPFLSAYLRASKLAIL